MDDMSVLARPSGALRPATGSPVAGGVAPSASAQSVSTQRSGAPADSRGAEIRRTAESFEAMFLAQMLAPMFDGLPTDGEFGGGAGERAFRPMLIEEYGKAIMRAGGVGVADAVAREMMRLQGIAPGAPAGMQGAEDAARR